MSRNIKQMSGELAQTSPIILMGRGHSGTRVLAWACTHLGIDLGTSPSLATGDVADLKFSQAIKKAAIKNVGVNDRASIKPKDINRLTVAAFNYFAGLGRPQGPWGWKFPETYLLAPYMAAIFPRARFVHMVRDGRDLAFKKHLTDDPARKLGKKILAQASALGLPHHLQAAKSWAYQVDGFDRFRADTAEVSVIDLKFENLLLEPRLTMQELCDFLGIDLTETCTNYLQATIKPQKVSQYRENDPAQVREVEIEIAQTLKRYHYQLTADGE